MLQRISLGEAARFVSSKKPLDKSTIALALKTDSVTVGCALFCASAEKTWTVHICMLEGYPSRPHAKGAFEYMAKNFGAKKINAYVPAHDRAAQHAAILAGMKREGYSPNAFWEDEIMKDVVYYGVNICLPQQVEQ